MPTSISYTIEPKLHQSDALPYGLPLRTSGAKYSGVPQSVLAPSFKLTFSFAKPKSVIFR